MKLKVCGLKHKTNIYEVRDAGVDYIGMIFYEKSPRYVVDNLYPEDVLFFNEDVEKIGVFVNASLEEIRSQGKLYQLDYIQLHGQESPEFCQAVSDLGFGVIKVFGVGENFDFSVMTPYQHVVDFFLFDTKTPEHGGSGKTFNWDILNNYTLDVPVFVGGGVGLDNLKELLNKEFPFLYAVDMNSKLEVEPGLKDLLKVEEAVAIVKG